MDNGAINYARFLNGDDDGLVEVIREYQDGLMLFINSYVRNIHIAEELTEETFCRLAIKQPRYTAKFTFKTWLYTIGRNLTVSYFRRSKRFSDYSERELERLQADTTAIEETYIKREEKIQLHKAILQLPRQYSEVLYLAYFAMLSREEISIVMKKSNKQIENLLYRSKIALKEQLIKEGFDYERL